jgi:hypothetical protein
VIPASVTSIEEEAFFGCTGLISLVIPESITIIADNAFDDCDQLEQVITPARFHHLFPETASLTEPAQYLLK